MSTEKLIQYYNSLKNGEKGKFLAILSLKVGNNPGSWHYLLSGKKKRDLTPIQREVVSQLIEENRWKQAFAGL